MKLFMANQGQLQELEEKTDPVFTSGDAYLIEDETNKNIWIWLGKSCSVDEKGTVAREAKQIDQEKYNGAAKITTVEQDQEPKEFLALFHSIKVLTKNLAKTMLKDVKTGSWSGQHEHVNVLYRISSEEFDNVDHMKFVQVPFKRESLDSEDCFIADLGDYIWIWQGKTSNSKEKTKAMKFAKEFDVKRAGNQKIDIFEDGVDDQPFLDLFNGKSPKGKVFLDYDPELGIMKEKPVEEPKPEPKAEPKPEPKAEPKPEPKAEPKPKPEQKQEVKKPMAEQPAQKGAQNVLTQKGTGRVACPACGNSDKYMIREVEDREKIILDYPLIYGKKYICGRCGAHWRREEEE